MTDLPAPQLSSPPTTGNREIDDALAGVAELETVDIAEHHARLAALQDLLGGVLESSRGGVATIPQALRPAGQHG